tara:strand:- start:923 stop:1861 length:939 start_codon:yes stop_codon:yes gene_type:complete
MSLPASTRAQELKLAKKAIENIMNDNQLTPPQETLKFNKKLNILTEKSAEAIIFKTGNRVVKVMRQFPPQQRMIKEYLKLQLLGKIGIGPKVHRIGLMMLNNQPRVAIEQQMLDGDIEKLLMDEIPKLSIPRRKKVMASFCSKLKRLLTKIWKMGLFHGDIHHGNIMYTLNKNDVLKLYLVDVETLHTNKYTPNNWQLEEIDITNHRTFRNQRTWMKAPIRAWMQNVCSFKKINFDRSYSKTWNGLSDYNAMMKYFGTPAYRRGNLRLSRALRPVSSLSTKQPGINKEYKKRLGLRRTNNNNWEGGPNNKNE